MQKTSGNFIKFLGVFLFSPKNDIKNKIMISPFLNKNVKIKQ